MNSKNIVAMRNLIEESTHDFYTSIAPQNVEKISITIPEGIINTAANGLLEDQSKILAWFGLDTTNTVSNYELSVNGQDITNGRLKTRSTLCVRATHGTRKTSSSAVSCIFSHMDGRTSAETIGFTR